MDENVSGVLSELSHHSCGFLFGVLHDDGHLLSDITDELIGNAWLGVQNCATNVDAVPEESTRLLLGTCVYSSHDSTCLATVIVLSVPGWVLQCVQVPAL